VVDHIKLFVSDVERSRRFYEQALEPVGYRAMLEPAPGVVGMGVDWPDFWIAAGGAGRAATTAHIAFRAASREIVDAFHRAALAAAGTDNGPAGPRPHYHPSYCGVFVHDPDGNNVEAVCHEPA
jgi:catechol 2,3-dioxygenase-like lactoylglutathione lyase family enzyme